MAPERLSGADRAWYRMDTGCNPMVITGVWFFESPMSRSALVDRLRERLLAHRRFRQRIRARGLGLWWVEDARFDLDWHVRAATLAPGDGPQALARLIERIAGTALPANRPLWRFHLIERLASASVLITRVHHCLGDGVALMRVVQGLDDRREAASPERAAGAAATVNPRRPVPRRRDRGGLLADALSIALLSRDSESCLRGKVGSRKRVAWNQPTPLAQWLSLARALNVSVNDVFASCVAGALRTYLRSRTGDVGASQLRALVPVDLRSAASEPAPGNQFGLVPLLLPVGEANPLARLREIHRRMALLKRGHQAPLSYLLLGLLGESPKALQQAVLGHLAERATLVMSNVRGPDEALRIGGNRLDRLLFWVPQAGDIGVGVSVLSYRQQVQFGLMTDAGLCPDPQRIADAFVPEFDRILLALAMLPRGFRLVRDPA